jgi:hypothetical protein
MRPHLCQLDAAAGRSEPCPGDTCPFWKDEQCLIAPLQADLARNACLVTYFLGLRASLARQVPAGPLREFHPPGLA